MLSLLWYYRPEHTDRGRRPEDNVDEIFASRHKDINSVACIEDRCFVLTFNEYCRYLSCRVFNRSYKWRNIYLFYWMILDPNRELNLRPLV